MKPYNDSNHETDEEIELLVSFWEADMGTIVGSVIIMLFPVNIILALLKTASLNLMWAGIALIAFLILGLFALLTLRVFYGNFILRVKQMGNVSLLEITSKLRFFGCLPYFISKKNETMKANNGDIVRVSSEGIAIIKYSL